MSSRGQIFVIEDDDAVRDALCFLFETSGFQVEGFASASAFLQAPPPGSQGCIITDVRMPGISGLELVNQLKAEGSSRPVIVITGHGDVPLAVQAMKAGAVDFLEKPFDDLALLKAVGVALANSSELTKQADDRSAIKARLATLSKRERQVLDGLVAGKANKVLALELGISPRTVEVYRANLMAKMQAGSLSELVRMVLLYS